jgi:spore coat protein YutH
MMKELLLVNYNIHVTEQVRINEREGFRDRDYIYFIISATNKEMIHLEQAALAYYLSEIGYNHTAIPIPTMGNSWFVEKDNNHYFVLRVADVQRDTEASHGKKLAEFHNKTSQYSYEPKEISSYGQWKNLWINKLTAFERKIEQEADSNQTKYYRLLVDVFPYLIGLSENAIQYLQESETDKRFHEGDQGVFAFRRYRHHLLEPVIWTDDLAYDHSSRDLAEFIRFKFLEEELDMREISSFLKDYQEIRPLSVFSWRLLYARLVYPIHFFDFIETGFNNNDERKHLELKQFLRKQEIYEERLGNLFESVNVDYKRYDFPVIKWFA